MQRYGLIGYPLGHSFSPAWFGKKFHREAIDACYEAYPIQRIEDFPALLRSQPELQGLNVTTPYKESVIPFLDELDPDAQAIGAVNCIDLKSGRLRGYNTDWQGFRDSLESALRPHHMRALVLGTGGAALAICFALKQMGIAFHTVSRKEGKADFSYHELRPEVIGDHPIIVNTTVLGTEGAGIPPLPYEAITASHLLYDLVYNPPLTPFLQEGKARGATVKNGLEMLELQAEASWRIWQGA